MSTCQVCGGYIGRPVDADWRYCGDCYLLMEKLAERMARGSFLTQATAIARIKSMLYNVREEHQESHRNEA